MLEIILLRGAMLSAVYASLAVGFSLVLGVSRIVNLAHTAFFMLAAYALFYTTNVLGFNVVLSIPLSIIFVTVIGILTYKILLERLRGHENAVLLVTVALALFFQETMILFFGGAYRGVGPIVRGNIEIIGVTTPIQQIIILVSTVFCLLAIVAFLYLTKLGLAIRVTTQDEEIANIMGISGTKTAMVSVVLAIALAATAGVLVAPTVIIEPNMWQSPMVMMFAAVILGGLGSMKGAFFGAFIIGYMEVIVVFLVPQGSYIKGAVALALVVIMLLLRPEGLFGVSFEEERL